MLDIHSSISILKLELPKVLLLFTKEYTVYFSLIIISLTIFLIGSYFVN